MHWIINNTVLCVLTLLIRGTRPVDITSMEPVIWRTCWRGWSINRNCHICKN